MPLLSQPHQSTAALRSAAHNNDGAVLLQKDKIGLLAHLHICSSLVAMPCMKWKCAYAPFSLIISLRSRHPAIITSLIILHRPSSPYLSRLSSTRMAASRPFPKPSVSSWHPHLGHHLSSRALCIFLNSPCDLFVRATSYPCSLRSPAAHGHPHKSSPSDVNSQDPPKVTGLWLCYPGLNNAWR